MVDVGSISWHTPGYSTKLCSKHNSVGVTHLQIVVSLAFLDPVEGLLLWVDCYHVPSDCGQPRVS